MDTLALLAAVLGIWLALALCVRVLRITRATVGDHRRVRAAAARAHSLQPADALRLLEEQGPTPAHARVERRFLEKRNRLAAPHVQKKRPWQTAAVGPITGSSKAQAAGGSSTPLSDGDSLALWLPLVLDWDSPPPPTRRQMKYIRRQQEELAAWQRPTASIRYDVKDQYYANVPRKVDWGKDNASLADVPAGVLGSADSPTAADKQRL